MKNSLIKMNKNQKAFSMVEILVAMFIFSLVSMMILGAYTDVFQARKKVRAIQQNVEDARYAMELMAKTLRMSSVFTDLSSVPNSIVIYDYSQKKCLQYRLDGNSHLVVGTGVATNISRDDGKEWVSGCGSFSNFKEMTTTSINKLSFGGAKSAFGTNKELGHVTIGFEICYDNSGQDCATDTVTVQTSVSLRDYSYIKDGS